MTLDKVAVVPSIGIGDGLVMMVASHRLKTLGYNVDTYSPALCSIQDWFIGHNFLPKPSIENLENIFSEYDLIILQNDNSEFSKKLISLRKENKLKSLSIFYPSYEKHKHEPLHPLDRVFNDQKPMVDNIATAIASLLGLNHTSKNNGLMPPSGLVHRKFKNRVLIHPTSSVTERTYLLDRYLHVAEKLRLSGFHPVICLSPKERESLIEQIPPNIDAPIFESLSHLASFAYESCALIGNESGTAHLCSNLQLPTIVVSACKKRIKLWRPGWYKGAVVTPSSIIPNIKGSRFREKKWKQCIFPSQILKRFDRVVH